MCYLFFYFFRPTIDESLVKGLKEGTGDLDGTIITRFVGLHINFKTMS